MRLRSCGWRLVLWLAVAALLPTYLIAASSQEEASRQKKPSIRLKANPPVAFSPGHIAFSAELIGGSDDYADFYCASVEWDWGDGTKSEVKADCEPYEPGKSEIQRRFVGEHTFRVSVGTGNLNQVRPTGSVDTDMHTRMPLSIQYRVRFTLKQKEKVVAPGKRPSPSTKVSAASKKREGTRQARALHQLTSLPRERFGEASIRATFPRPDGGPRRSCRRLRTDGPPVAHR
jgi:hypothetical protein